MDSFEPVLSGVAHISVANDARPIDLFQEWLDLAKTHVPRWNILNMATATPDGRVSSRSVVAREWFPDGAISILTQSHTKKAQQIKENDWVALCYVWSYKKAVPHSTLITRQIRIEGIAEILSKEKAEKYFKEDFIHSKIRNNICQSGRKCDNWNKIKEAHDQLAAKIILQGVNELKMPDYMEAYKVRPEVYEFYYDHTNYIGDRIRFERNEEGYWKPWERIEP